VQFRSSFGGAPSVPAAIGPDGGGGRASVRVDGAFIDAGGFRGHGVPGRLRDVVWRPFARLVPRSV